MNEIEKAFADFVDDFYAAEPATQKQIAFSMRIARALSISCPKNPTKLQAQKWINDHIDSWHDYCDQENAEYDGYDPYDFY